MAGVIVDCARAALKNFTSILAAFVLVGVTLGRPPAAQAQVWNGVSSDLWGTATNWTPNTVPNSSTASATVAVALNNPLLINISPTIANLTVGASSSVTLSNGNDLTIAGGTSAGSLDLAGTLTVDSSGSLTDFILAGTTGSTITLSGGNSLILSNSSNNRIYSTTGDTLVNDSGNTIQGSGQFGIDNSSYEFTLNNAGIIDANQSNYLQIEPTNTITNTGTLEATSGATLYLPDTITNTGGLIKASGSGSLVELETSTITGGTLTNSGGGIVQNSGTATFSGVTISSGSTLTLVNDSTTTISGSITNNGTIAQNSTGSLTDLILSGSISLAGPLNLSNSFNNRIYGGGSDSLTNQTGNTIQGAGQIGINNSGYAFTLDNKGTIDANQSAGMTIAPTNTITNTGTIEATSGATLDLPSTVTNTGGLIQASGSGSLVELETSTITGGTLTNSGGGIVQNSGTATFSGVTISSGSTLTLVNDSTTTISGSITNNGTIAQNSTGSLTDLILSGSISLAGPLNLSNSFNNRIYGGGSDSLTNQTGNTIQGAGQIGINNSGYAFTLDNKGTIDANQSAGMTIAPTNTITNTGTIEATSGATLDLPSTVTNTGGLIQASGSGSLVELETSAITGGTLTNSGGGIVQNSGTATFSGVTISSGSTLTLINDSTTTLEGTIVNNGTIAQNSTGSLTDLHINGAVALSGSGVWTLSNNANNRIYATGSDSLTIGANQTIQGAGQLGINNAGFAFTLTINGTIDANQSNGLTVAPTNTTTSGGTLEATSGGTLTLAGGTFNITGPFSVSASSALNLGGSFTASTLTNNGTTNVNGSGSINTITGGGILNVNGASNTLKLTNSSAQSSQILITVASGDTLDITNDSIIINYAGASDLRASYQTLVNNGDNGGSWNGTTSITSSTVAAYDAGHPNAYEVALADGGDGSGNTTLGSHQLELTAALAGDANLSGKVDSTDLGIVLGDWQKTGQDWDEGSFNGSGTVDSTNLGLLLANWQATTSLTVSQLDEIESLTGDSVVANADGSGLQLVSVPEPATLGLLAIGALALPRRKRRMGVVSR